jgi:hypothetical protein
VFNFINSFRDETVKDRTGLPGSQWTTLPEVRGCAWRRGNWS